LNIKRKKIKASSPEHHRLMYKAIKAKLEQNPKALKLLLETGNKKITHILKDRTEQSPRTANLFPAMFLLKF
jgi:hypothetical protein